MLFIRLTAEIRTQAFLKKCFLLSGNKVAAKTFEVPHATIYSKMNAQTKLSSAKMLTDFKKDDTLKAILVNGCHLILNFGKNSEFAKLPINWRVNSNFNQASDVHEVKVNTLCVLQTLRLPQCYVVGECPMYSEKLTAVALHLYNKSYVRSCCAFS